jgi:hypothetical protein
MITDDGGVVTNTQSTGSAATVQATAVAYSTGNILAVSVSTSTRRRLLRVGVSMFKLSRCPRRRV